jgi:hypothetical protein
MENLNDIQKTIDNFGLFWVIIQCMTSQNLFLEYIRDRDFVNRSMRPELYNIYLNFYFNLDNSPQTDLRQELEKLFGYEIIPNFREKFIANVFSKMSKPKYELYFKNNIELFNPFMNKILDLVIIDPKTRIQKEILLEDPFFQIE